MKFCGEKCPEKKSNKCDKRNICKTQRTETNEILETKQKPNELRIHKLISNKLNKSTREEKNRMKTK